MKSDIAMNTNEMPSSPQPQESVEEEKTLAGLLTQDTPDDYSVILYMLQAFVGMTICFFLILFVAPSVSFPLCILITAYLAYSEHRQGIHSPVTLSLAALYPVLYILLLTDSEYLPYFGLGVFAWLSIMGFVLLLLKKPMSMTYAKGKGSMRLHYVISIIWQVSWLLSFFSGLLLMPSVWYLIVPFCICLATFFVVIYLSFFDTKLLTRRKKEFTLGEYTFKQLAYPSPEFEEYIDFYALHVANEIFNKPEHYPALRERAHQIDAFEMKERIPFGAYHDGKLVGILAISIPGKGEIFPFEKATGSSFDSVRTMGPICDLGRMVIAKSYRERPDVLRGLLKAVLEVSLERDVVFMVAQVYPNASMFHFRLGFKTLFKRGDPRFTVDFGAIGVVIVFFNNLANTIFFQTQKINESTQLGDTVDELLAERWIKRMVVRHAFSRPEKRPWLHTIESIRHLVGPPPAQKEETPS